MIETLVSVRAYTIMMIDGGMMGPTIAVAAVAPRRTPAVAAFFIIRMSIDPGPAASASAEPLMPEKNVSVRTLVCEAAAHVSDQLGREAKQHLGERPARHQLGRQDEERYREQRKAVDAREHGLHRDHRVDRALH